MRKRVLQWVQVVIGIYSFIYVPIEFLLLTHSHSADLPVLNYLPEFFIGYGVASADIYIFVGLLFMAFIFFGAFSVKSEKKRIFRYRSMLLSCGFAVYDFRYRIFAGQRRRRKSDTLSCIALRFDRFGSVHDLYI